MTTTVTDPFDFEEKPTRRGRRSSTERGTRNTSRSTGSNTADNQIGTGLRATAAENQALRGHPLIGPMSGEGRLETVEHYLERRGRKLDEHITNEDVDWIMKRTGLEPGHIRIAVSHLRQREGIDGRKVAGAARRKAAAPQPDSTAVQQYNAVTAHGRSRALIRDLSRCTPRGRKIRDPAPKPVPAAHVRLARKSSATASRGLPPHLGMVAA